jgi:hypothetical protein
VRLLPKPSPERNRPLKQLPLAWLASEEKHEKGKRIIIGTVGPDEHITRITKNGEHTVETLLMPQ